MKHKGPHKLTRVELGKNKYNLYKCTLKGCSHTIDPQLLLGRETLCNECDVPLIVQDPTDLIKQPKCKTCRKKEDVDMKEVEEVIERLK